jgi:hypothetical protein
MGSIWGRGTLFSAGKKLAVAWPELESMFMFSEFHVNNLELSVDYYDVTRMAFGFTESIAVRETCNISVVAGRPKQIPLDEGMKLFRSVDSMSVSDLLAAAYQKMDVRSSQDAEID